MSDRDLLARVHDAVRDERAATARLIALLMELDRPSTVRKLPTNAVSTPAEPQRWADCDVSISIDPAPCLSPVSPSRPADVKAIAPERYKMQFTVSRETYNTLRRAQDLLRHTVPNGDPAIIFERALRLLVQSSSAQSWQALSVPARRVVQTLHPVIFQQQ